MRKDRPSRTALKVALAVVTLGAKPEMMKVLPPGIVKASQELLLASGAVGARTLRWAGSRKALSVYEAFDWMLPGQFEAFAHRKAFFERQVRNRGHSPGSVPDSLAQGMLVQVAAGQLRPKMTTFIHEQQLITIDRCNAGDSFRGLAACPFCEPVAPA